jgi:hypothetical protein
MIDDFLKKLYEPLQLPVRNFIVDMLNGDRWEHRVCQIPGCYDTAEIIAALKELCAAQGMRTVMIAEVKGDYSISELERIAVIPSLCERATTELIFRDERLAARAVPGDRN